MDSGRSELVVLGVFQLAFHPGVERIVSITTEILPSSGNNNIRKCFQLPARCRYRRPQRQSGAGQFLRRDGLVVVVHDVNVSVVGHSRFENGRFRSGQSQVQSGADDPRFDESVARLPFEVPGQRHCHADDVAGQWRHSQRALDFRQLDVVSEIVSLCLKQINLDF